MTFSSRVSERLSRNRGRWPSIRVLETGSTKRLRIVQLASAPYCSFKYRGAALAVHRAVREAKCPAAITLVATSSGNFGTAVARTANEVGAKAVIFMPATAPEAKRKAVEQAGGEVVQDQETYEDATAAARRFSAEDPSTRRLIGSLDESIQLGAGSYLLELIQEADWTRYARRAIVLPMGVGSLAFSTFRLLEELEIEADVYIPEPVGFAKVSAFQRGDSRLADCPTIADGVAIRSVPPGGELWLRSQRIFPVPVEEEVVLQGMRFLWQEFGLKAEGAGALAPGLFATEPERFEAYDRVWCFVTGTNISAARFSRLVGDPETMLPRASHG